MAKATFRFISDPQAQVASLRAGDVDAQTNLAAPEAVAQLKADPKLKVSFGKTEGEVILATNNAKPPFNDLRVRQAIAHGLDRKTIALGVYGSDVDLIGSHISPLHPAYVDLTNTYPVDIAKAKALLVQAGHPNGFTCTLRLPPPAYARRSGEIIATLKASAPFDFVLSPVSPVPSFPAELASPIHDPERPFEHIVFAVAANMSDQPSVSVHAGMTAEGLQITGRRFDDLGVPRMARAWERLRGSGPDWPVAG